MECFHHFFLDFLIFLPLSSVFCLTSFSILTFFLGMGVLRLMILMSVASRVTRTFFPDFVMIGSGRLLILISVFCLTELSSGFFPLRLDLLLRSKRGFSFFTSVFWRSSTVFCLSKSFKASALTDSIHFLLLDVPVASGLFEMSIVFWRSGKGNKQRDMA